MTTNWSKSAFLHRQIRRGLQAGRYLPGQRIDPATLASEFHISPTPVRFALYRLVGEGLVIDHARNGLYVPLPTEVAMHDLYDWMERLLVMACDIVPASPRARRTEPQQMSAEDDLVKLTWKMFDGMAAATGHRSLHRAVKQANDRLAPIRRAKQCLIDDPVEELMMLSRTWHSRDIPALRRALVDYHRRRRQLVPQIVDLLSERSGRLH